MDFVTFDAAPDGMSKGDRILCENRQRVAFATGEIRKGDLFWARKIQFIGKQTAIGTPPEECVCRKCGANWLHKSN